MKKKKPKVLNVQGTGTAEFTSVARRVLGRLIESTQTVIRELPQSPRTAADLMRVLGVSRKVAWQTFRVAEAEDPLAAVNFVPGQKPVRDLISAALGMGVDPKAAQEFGEAFAEFERLVRDTAGDRNAFVSMLGDSARDPSANSDADRVHRLNAFKSFSHFCGMQAQHSLDVLLLSEPVAGKRTTVQLRTVAGLCRFRENAQFVVERRRHYSEGQPFDIVNTRPLDPAAAEKYHAPVLPPFCSRPMPEFTVKQERKKNEDYQRIEWASGQVGIKHFVDVTTGFVTEVDYEVPQDDKPHGIRLMTGVGFPVHRLTRYILIHKPGSVIQKPTLTAYLDPHAAGDPDVRKGSQTLHVGEKIESFEAGSWPTVSEGFSDIRELVAYTTALMGWDPSDFTIFRISIEYPLYNSSILIEVPWTSEPPPPPNL